MELPQTLTDLAGILKLRKQSHNPYNLLLTSTISLTPEVLIDISGTADWNEFCAWLRRLGFEDRILILKHHLSKPREHDGYLALAHLVKEGYFSTVLTTNLDSFLEGALFECGLRSTDYQTLVVNRDRDEYIAIALESEPRSIRIVKLRGSLSDNVIPATFPELFDFRSTLRNGLERYLNRDIVIVGSIEREDDLRRSLAYHGGRIYYALPQSPSYNDDIVKAIRARGIDLNAAVISGSYGHFGTFFKALQSILLLNTSPGLAAPSNENQQIRAPKPEEASRIASVTVPSQVPVLSPAQSKKAQTASPAPDRQETLQKAASLSTKVEKVQEADLTGLVESQQTSLPEREGRGATSLVRILAVIVLILAGTSGFFLIVSLFANNTPSFNPASILLLLIIVIVTILAIVGIMTPKQVTDIFSSIVGVVGGILPKSKDEQTGKIESRKGKGGNKVKKG